MTNPATVKDLIAYLKTQNEDAIVQVVVVNSSGYETYGRFTNLNIENHINDCCGGRILEIGEV